jgi:transformer-2 protein
MFDVRRGDQGIIESNPGNNLHVSGLTTRVESRDLEEAFSKVGRVHGPTEKICSFFGRSPAKNSANLVTVWLHVYRDSELNLLPKSVTEISPRDLFVKIQTGHAQRYIDLLRCPRSQRSKLDLAILASRVKR